MAVPTVIFENNDKAAHAVSRYIDDLRPSPQRFTLRPFQRHSPAFSPWWFVPSTEWPAYHCSKLFIHRFLPASEYLYTGFYVEHGLGKDLPDVKPSLVTQSNWYWFEFLHQAKNGALDPALRQVLERSGCPVFVWLDAYAFNRVPTPEEVAQTPDDLIEFVIRSADLQFELTEQGNEILSLSLPVCTNWLSIWKDRNKTSVGIGSICISVSDCGMVLHQQVPGEHLRSGITLWSHGLPGYAQEVLDEAIGRGQVFKFVVQLSATSMTNGSQLCDMTPLMASHSVTGFIPTKQPSRTK